MSLRSATRLAQFIRDNPNDLITTSIQRLKGYNNYAIVVFHTGLKRKILIYSCHDWQSIQEAWKSVTVEST